MQSRRAPLSQLALDIVSYPESVVARELLDEHSLSIPSREIAIEPSISRTNQLAAKPVGSAWADPPPSSLEASIPNVRPSTDTWSSIPDPATRRWSLDALAGRFVEISAPLSTSACGLTAAAALLLEAQLRGEPGAWVEATPSIFFPPDLAAFGVDLAALPVIRVGDSIAAARAADRLLRSEGFGIVVLDLGEERRAQIPIPLQTRLVGLAHRHHTALVCLTRKPSEASSIGSLISLRAEGTVRRTAFDRFEWQLHILKDKRQGPGWGLAEVCRGPDGLC